MTQITTKNGNCCQTQDQDCVRSNTTYRPRFDICETDDALLLYGDLPGVLPHDLDIQFENGELLISGQVTERHSENKQIHREYGVGNFQRSFAVNEMIDVEHISADLKDGVLVITLPKSEAVRPRKIKVQS